MIGKLCSSTLTACIPKQQSGPQNGWCYIAISVEEVSYCKVDVMWYFLLRFQLSGKYGMFHSVLNYTDLTPVCEYHVHACNTGPE